MSSSASSGQPPFATTHWSIVLEAGQGKDADGSVALAELCKKYWLPLYAYVRRRVQDTNEAQDLTQEFFTRLLEKEILAQATPERGRFRSFLLTAMQNFLTNEWRKTQASKRGGCLRTLSLDFTSGDSKLNFEPGHAWTAEKIFDRNWSITLLDHVLSQLREEYAAAGKAELFTALRPFISSNRQESSLAALGEQLNMTEGAVKVASHRLRKRYRELLREELTQTVADPKDVDDEIAWLFNSLAGP